MKTREDMVKISDEANETFDRDSNAFSEHLQGVLDIIEHEAELGNYLVRFYQAFEPVWYERLYKLTARLEALSFTVTDGPGNNITISWEKEE